jgi:hypothetical protein
VFSEVFWESENVFRGEASFSRRKRGFFRRVFADGQFGNDYLLARQLYGRSLKATMPCEKGGQESSVGQALAQAHQRFRPDIGGSSLTLDPPYDSFTIDRRQNSTPGGTKQAKKISDSRNILGGATVSRY